MVGLAMATGVRLEAEGTVILLYLFPNIILDDRYRIKKLLYQLL